MQTCFLVLSDFNKSLLNVRKYLVQMFARDFLDILIIENNNAKTDHKIDYC